MNGDFSKSESVSDSIVKNINFPASGSGGACAKIGRVSIVSWAEILSDTLCSEANAGYRRSLVALVVFLGLLGAMLIWVGAAPITGPWDMAAFLDGGWRIIEGQVPHTDYHNPIGALTYLLVAFGMKVAAPSTSAVAYGSVLFMALLSPVAWYLASRRLPWAIAFVFALFMSVYLVTPRPPGYEVSETTYAMIYNRHGYVLLSLLILCAFLKPRVPATENRLTVEGLITGALLALTLYCKITYFLIAAALTLPAAILAGHPRRWFLAATLAFAGVCAGFFLVLHINLYAYLWDIAAAGQAQSAAMRVKLISDGFFNNATSIYLFVVCLLLWTWASDPHAKRQLIIWIIALSILAAAMLITSGNAAQRGGRDDPLYFVAAIVSLELFRRWNDKKVTQAGTTVRFAHTASLALLLPVLCGKILIRDLASCAYAIAWNIEKRPAFDSSRRLHSLQLSDFNVPSSTGHITAYWPAREYPDKINDGIDLLRGNLQKGDRVTTIAFSNPFSFALGLSPAHDYFNWWDLNFSFDRSHFPPAKDFLGDATVVMVPRLAQRSQGWGFETVDVLLEIYGDYLRANFHVQASTETWVLYRQNS